MLRKRARKWIGICTTAGLLLQITACLGPDPQLLLANIAINTIVSNVVTTIYQLLLGGLNINA